MKKTVAFFFGVLLCYFNVHGQSSPGDIAIIGYNSDPSDNLAWVTFVDIADGTEIFFEDNEWNGSSFNSGEGVITWTNNTGSSISAGTVITMDELSSGMATTSTGSISVTSPFNPANSNDGVFVYIGAASNPTTFLYAMTNGSTIANGLGSIANTGLIQGFTAVLLSSGTDIGQYNGPKTSLTQNQYLEAIAEVDCFWDEQDGTNSQASDGTAPDLPFFTTLFSIAATSSTTGLVISEIMYNSPGNDDEWIEICNTSGASIALTGFTLNYDVSSYTFPSASLGAGECAVVIVGDDGDGDAFNEDCIISATGANVYVVPGVTVGGASTTNALPNAPSAPGVAIILEDNIGNTIDFVYYDDDDGADGNGKTFYLPTLTDANITTCANWSESIDDGGSPLATGGTCALACEITNTGLSIACSTNGTANILTDDTYTFTLSPSGTNVAATYTFNGNSGVPASAGLNGGGSYNTTSSTFGPFAITGGNKFITIEDASNPTCTLDLVIPAPAAGCGSVSSVSINTSASASGTSTSAQNAAASLDDAFRVYEEQFCPGTYTPAVASWVDACGNGPSSTISGLSLSIINTMGVAYSTATLTEKLVSIDNSDITSLGSNRTGGCGSFGGSNIASGSSLQGDSPLPNDPDLGNNYYNAASSLSSSSASGASTKAALAINFSSAVNRVGLFIADTESRSDLVDGYPAVVAFFNGATLLALEPIPTGTVNQSNCDGDNTSSANGCGNDETVFIQYINESTPITDIIVTVGQVRLDPSNVRNNTNSMALFALTIGGTCNFNFLPVELTAFEVYPTATTNEVYWQTATEENNDYFILERSQDGFNFEAIGEIEGAGNSLRMLDYYFTDEAPLEGTSYYRLKQVDFDGQHYISEMRSVFRAPKGIAPQLFPNVTSNETILHFGSPLEKNTRIEVVNLLGQSVKSYHLVPGSIQQEITVQALPAGQYFVIIENESPIRFIKQ